MGKKPKKKRSPTQLVLGVAWYRKDQWGRLLEISRDRVELESTYDRWLEHAWKSLGELRELGILADRVDVETEELLRWCEMKGVPVDGASRSKFASEKIRLMHSKKSRAGLGGGSP